MKAARNIFYYAMKPFIRLYYRLLHNLVFKSNALAKAQGPYLVIGHHVRSDDPIVTLMATNKLVRFLAADANMDTPWKRYLFNAMGMVPFRKKRSDMKSIRQLNALAKENEAIGLYPEGGRNWDGATDQIIPSTAKLIKMLRIDVYATKYEGSYLSRPRWADYSRRGKMVFSSEKLFSAEEIKSLSVDEIYHRMHEALQHNDYEWQRQEMIPFKGRSKAMGITRLLFKCPSCQAEHKLMANGNDFTCQACGTTYHINKFGFIEGSQGFDNTVDWYQWQKSFIPAIAETMTAYELNHIRYETRETKSNLRTIYKDTKVTLFKKTLHIEGESIDVSIPISDTFGYSFTLMDLFEFFTTNCKHRLVFDPELHLSNVFILDLLTELKENSKHE